MKISVKSDEITLVSECLNDSFVLGQLVERIKPVRITFNEKEQAATFCAYALISKCISYPVLSPLWPHKN